MSEKVVLVTPDDKVIGLMDKMEAHENGLLHRAFSVFLFNNEGKMLLHRRSASKYHSPNQWTNACCSHPRENETYRQAAERRLQEELGISCPIEERFHFTYKADVGDGLTEHEIDHVFTGTFEGPFQLNPEEVAEVKFVDPTELEEDLKKNPQNYTAWFKIILKEYKDRIN